MNPGGSGRTILVIDDDPDIQFVVQVILEDAQLRVLPAFTAEAGLLIAAERTVDLRPGRPAPARFERPGRDPQPQG
ncbi:MAG TPA: hypothetical protein VES03_08655, partial [Motilibacterales bacterium]|nr:hypothetical protein [Motilibacterales bacterium]